MVYTFLIFALALFLVAKGATFATTYAAKLAQTFRLSKYTVGFIVIAIISVLPETFISLNAAAQGMPSFGLGMLLGSNIADLTLIFALIVLSANREIHVHSKILENRIMYTFLLLLPLVLGLDGFFSRIEGLILILSGGIFYYTALKNGSKETSAAPRGTDRLKHAALLLVGMAALLYGSHVTVESASDLASYLGISPILIGMLIVGLGTTMPELFFSIQSVRSHDDSLAVGDLLGTVLADATIVIGLLAVIQPFAFPTKIIYITGTFMVLACVILFAFLRSRRTLSKKEAFFLFLFWLLFVVVEFLANT